jgi:large subunit ribosomal protein L15e
MNAYDYIKESLRSNLKPKLIEWRREGVFVKLEKPSDIGRARKLGYKDKKGISIIRVKIIRGGRTRSVDNARRKGKRKTIRLTLKMNYQWVAEQRAAKRFTNLEVLNSYQVGKDGQHYFFEVIMIDPERPEIKSDPAYSWISQPANRGRVFRGLTSAGRKSRGLRNKGPSLKVRPSINAWSSRGK